MILLVALLYSAGRTVYAQWGNLTLFASTSAGSLTMIAVFGRKLAVLFGTRVDGKRLPWMSAIGMYVGGFGAMLVLLITLSATAEMIIYQGRKPEAVPANKEHVPRFVLTEVEGHSELELRVSRTSAPVAPAAPVDATRAPPTGPEVHPRPDSTAAGWTIAVLLIASLAFGASHTFLNGSAHLPLYAARLTRAYLGASNPARVGTDAATTGTAHLPADQVASPQAATHVIPGDDIAPADYWRRPAITSSECPYLRGAPLHIINVTINETIDDRSQIQQADRKGLGMALGPCGVSAGVRHHAIMSWEDTGACHVTCGDATFRVFDYPALKHTEQSTKTSGSACSATEATSTVTRCKFGGESLSIGRWLGISGAAFSTGLGFRTNAGLSLLAGLANVRLGYWWDSNISRLPKWKRVLGLAFWVHSYLQREFLARFPGTANQRWYLSDGGHFENMGAYELIRRKLPQIIVVDAEADAGYEFEGLGNLVRKARLDFGAEIEFLSHDMNGGTARMGAIIKQAMLSHVGSLEELGRGVWRRTDALSLPANSEGARKRHDLPSPDPTGRSLAHAAVAKITYADGSRGSLLYIKPTLTGDEPADVLRYHREHPAFPHESTGDQFFDEAQWESYRRLGQHIGEQLFLDQNGPFT